MLFSHHFSSPETLNRARYWLTWHGFEVKEPRRSTDGLDQSHWLALSIRFSEAAAVRSLIGSIEHSDPNAGAGASSSKRWAIDAPSGAAPLGSVAPSGTPIHWHSPDDSSRDATTSKVAEYMFSRWE